MGYDPSEPRDEHGEWTFRGGNPAAPGIVGATARRQARRQRADQGA